MVGASSSDDAGDAGLWVYYNYVDADAAWEKAVVVKFKVRPEENGNMFFAIIFWLVIYGAWVVGVSAMLYWLVL